MPSEPLNTDLAQTPSQGLPINDVQNWQAGWLPGVYQGTLAVPRGSRISYLHQASL